MATLYLKYIDCLIARETDVMNDQQPANADPQNISHKAVNIVRSCLQLIEAGRWLEIMDSALEGAAKAKGQAIECRIVSAARSYESCIHKIMHGDARTGYRIFRSNGLHHPSPEIVKKM